MPCRGPDTDSFGRTRPEIIEGMRKELDETSRLLCHVMRILDNADGDAEYLALFIAEEVEGLPEWWKAHKELDRKREEKRIADKNRRLAAAAKKQEKYNARAAVLAKLSAEERKLLGF